MSFYSIYMLKRNFKRSVSFYIDFHGLDLQAVSKEIFENEKEKEYQRSVASMLMMNSLLNYGKSGALSFNKNPKTINQLQYKYNENELLNDMYPVIEICYEKCSSKDMIVVSDFINVKEMSRKKWENLKSQDCNKYEVDIEINSNFPDFLKMVRSSLGDISNLKKIFTSKNNLEIKKVSMGINEVLTHVIFSNEGFLERFEKISEAELMKSEIEKVKKENNILSEKPVAKKMKF